MAQKFYVDLDLTNHKIEGLLAAEASDEAVNLGQLTDAIGEALEGITGEGGALDGYVPDTRKVDTGRGLTGGGDLADDLMLDVAIGVGLEFSGDNEVQVSETWIDDKITELSANNLEAGDGIAIVEGTGGDPDVVSVVAGPTEGNAVVVSSDGVFVEDLSGALTDLEDKVTDLEASVGNIDVQGVGGEIGVSETGGVYTVGLDAAFKATVAAKADQSALQAEIDRATAAEGLLDTNKADKTTTVTAGTGLTGGGTLGGNFAVGIDTDWLGTQIATGAASKIDVNGVTGQTTVVKGDGTFEVGIDPAYTTARDTAANAAASAAAGAVETAVNGRIDEINITTDGYIVVDKTGDVFNLTLEAVRLADTYSGTASNGAEIDAQLDGTDVQAGDLYINTGTGSAFIYSGTAWVELAAASAGINAINVNDSLTIANPTGPTSSLAVKVSGEADQALKLNAGEGLYVKDLTDEIEAVAGDVTNLQTNVTNLDNRVTTVENKVVTIEGDVSTIEQNITTIEQNITELTTDSHKAANAALASAIEVDPDTQEVSLNLASSELSQSAAGLAIDLSGYATTGSVSGAIADTHKAATGVDAIDVDADTQAVSLKIADPDGVLSQDGSGLAIDLSDFALKSDLEGGLGGDVVTAGIAVTVGGQVVVSGGTGTFTHNLGTEDVIVAVRDGACFIGAAVCTAGVNAVTVEATDGTYRVIVTGGRVAG
jgi:hypothetical protein